MSDDDSRDSAPGESANMTKVANDEKQALQRQHDLAKLQAEIATHRAESAKQQAELAKSLLGTSDLKPPAGTIQVEKLEIEPTTLAYAELGQVAEEIAKAVAELPQKQEKTVVLMAGDELPADLRLFEAFRERAEVLKALWQRSVQERPTARVLRPLGPTAGLAAGMVATRSVLDLLAFARSNTEIKGVEVAIEDKVLVTLVAGHLTRDHDLTVYAPQLFPDAPDTTGTARVSVSSVLQSMWEARQKAIEEGDESAQGVIDELKELHDAFEASLVQVGTDTNTPLMGQLISGAALLNRLQQRALTVRLSVAAAGGSTRGRQFLLRNRVDYGGGAIATYAVFDNQRVVRAADTISSYEGYVRIGTSKRSGLLEPRRGALRGALGGFFRRLGPQEMGRAAD